MASSEAFATLVVAFAVFTDSILYDVVIPLLPGLFSHRLGIPQDQVQAWTSRSLEAFGLAQFVMNWLAGYATDRSHNKSRPFVFGLVVMIGATMLFFLSVDPVVVILARALQGASAALVWVSGIAFLVSYVTVTNLGRYMGYTMMAATMGELLGPVLGGPVYERFGYWFLFALVEGLLAVDVVLRLLMRTGPTAKPNEVHTGTAGERDALITHSSLSDAIGAGRDGAPSVDLSERDRPSLPRDWAASVAATAVVVTIRCGLEAALPLFVINRFEWSTSEAGWTMMLLLLPTTLAPWIGEFTMRYGPRWSSSTALVVCGCLLMALGRFSDHNRQHEIMFLVLVFGIGLCIAVTTNAHATAISAAAKLAEEKHGQGGSAAQTHWLSTSVALSGLSTAWSFGMFVGPVCVGSLRYDSEEPWARLCLYAGCFCIAPGVALSFTWQSWRA